jgi:hypothetical protein
VAHSLLYHTITTLSIEELVKQLQLKVKSKWNNYWWESTTNSGRGLFIRSIKDEAGSWPWAFNKNRAIETALSRLQTGHAGVRAHLACFNLVDSPLCPCGMPKTIQHFLLHCPTYVFARTNLTNLLTQLKVPVNLKNLLGGGRYSCAIQDSIVEAVATFLISTNMLYVV